MVRFFIIIAISGEVRQFRKFIYNAMFLGIVLMLKTILSFVFAYLLIHTGVLHHVAAQHNSIIFKHLSTVEGLSNFTVLSVAQDHLGFMWFGTMNRLIT